MNKYIAYFDVQENEIENRYHCLSSTNKVGYIIDAINENKLFIDIISASYTLNNRKYKAKTIALNPYTTLKLLKTLPWGNKIKRIISVLSNRLELLFCLLKSLNKDDTVIVYHSLGYLKTIAFVKKIVKFRLILEIEEIYGDVINSPKIINSEMNYFKNADGYIFSTKLLNEKINICNKPYVIIHGVYKTEKDTNTSFGDDKIHCVYAGTFDEIKGGAKAAIAAALYLDSRYHMHIIGFGSENDKRNIIKQIANISKNTQCILTYDGLLSGKAYIEFIKSCQIGLATQNPNEKFNDTSFPSKVLSYMTNGLRVVCAKIKVLETSAVSDLIYYYEEQTPKAIAKAIKNIDINSAYDCTHKIRELDFNFSQNIKSLLEINKDAIKNHKKESK